MQDSDEVVVADLVSFVEELREVLDSDLGSSSQVASLEKDIIRSM